MNTRDVSFNCFGRPRNITIDIQIKEGVLEIIDFPTVISGINHAISNLLPQDFNRLTPNYNNILDRELRRFITTLEKLLLRSGFNTMLKVIKDSRA